MTQQNYLNYDLNVKVVFYRLPYLTFVKKAEFYINLNSSENFKYII